MIEIWCLCSRYEGCEWGWKESVKREELFDDDSCFLIARSSDDTLLAFSHFRFDLDYGRPVLYWYVNDIIHINVYNILSFHFY